MQEGAIYKSQSASQPVSGWASGLEEGTCQPGGPGQPGWSLNTLTHCTFAVTATAEQDKEGQEDKIPSPVMYSFNYVLTPR